MKKPVLRRKNQSVGPEEIKRMILASEIYDEPEKELSFCLALYSGMRVNEICQMKWDWIADNFFEIRIPRYAAKYKHGRVVPAPFQLRSKLYKASEFNFVEVRSEYVFPGRIKGHISKRSIQRWIDKIIDKAGANTTPHGLRHTYATLLYHKGKVDIQTIASLLGHNSIRTTGIYIEGLFRSVGMILDGIFDFSDFEG